MRRAISLAAVLAAPATPALAADTEKSTTVATRYCKPVQ
jgi:hypothetical protein